MDTADHLDPTTAGHVHVEKHDVGLRVGDDVDCLVDLACFPDDLDRVTELGAYAAAHQPVAVHQHAADRAHARACRGTVSATSVPVGPLRIAALPPLRVIRPPIDSRMPRRSAGS